MKRTLIALVWIAGIVWLSAGSCNVRSDNDKIHLHFGGVFADKQPCKKCNFQTENNDEMD